MERFARHDLEGALRSLVSVSDVPAIQVDCQAT
jgi:hypothetical protein